MQLGAQSYLRTQRNERVDAGGAAGREVTGGQGHYTEEKRHREECRQVGGLHFEPETGDGPASPRVHTTTSSAMVCCHHIAEG